MVSRVRPVAALLAAGSLVGLSACGQGRASPPTQVAVRVNGGEISVHQVELALAGRGATMPAAAASAAARSVLLSLVDQELAAQAARKGDLDRDPRVLQLIEAARRQILSQAYQERVGARASDPSSDEIERYYRAHPELFGERRLYGLQETTLGGRAERLDALKTHLDAATSAAMVQEAVRAAGVRASSRFLSISAEDLPQSLLVQLAALKEGQSLWLPREGGARVLTLLTAQRAPLPREAAQRMIADYLVNERRRELVDQSLQSLRESSRVEYVGQYAAIGQPEAAPAADGKR